MLGCYIIFGIQTLLSPPGSALFCERRDLKSLLQIGALSQQAVSSGQVALDLRLCPFCLGPFGPGTLVAVSDPAGLRVYAWMCVAWVSILMLCVEIAVREIGAVVSVGERGEGNWVSRPGSSPLSAPSSLCKLHLSSNSRLENQRAGVIIDASF